MSGGLSIDLLMVFCEGPHDVAFNRMVFKKVMGYELERVQFSKMPAPLNNLFKQTVNNHAASDMSLDMAHKFFLPDSVLRKDDVMVLLFNTGGKDCFDKVRSLLSDYVPMLGYADTFSVEGQEVVNNVGYVFSYDCDALGINAAVEMVSREYGAVNEERFIDQEWVGLDNESIKLSGNKMVVVWGENSQRGTLEDVISPMFSGSEKCREEYKVLDATLSQVFDWDIDAEDETRSTAEASKFKKAVLTALGQRKKPGSSLNVIIEQSGFIGRDELLACAATSGFVKVVEEELLRT